jgi:hypothetical protein
MRLKAFIEMLRQVAPHFTLSDIVECVFVWQHGAHYGFMLVMQNGEYWYVTNLRDMATFVLWKYPPPIPVLPDLMNAGLLPSEPSSYETHPKDINHYLTEMGGSSSMFLVEHP